MLSSSVLLLGALFAASVLAQTRIAFTSVPAVVVAGESYNITWGGGDGSPVTITLRKGEPNDLTTVDTLADGVTHNFFLWTVPTSLQTATDYALQITQGQDDINYSGMFSLAGGSGPSTISYSGMTTASASGNATAHGTSSTVASLGTSSALPRNATFSAPSMSRTSSLPPAVTQHAGTTSSEGTSISASTTAAATSAPSGGAGHVGSSAALALGLFAAIMCLS